MKKDSFEKKLAAYVAMSAAYLVAHPVDANAQIMYTDVTPDDTIQNSFFNLDLNNDGVSDFKLRQITNFFSTNSSLWEKELVQPFNNNMVVGHCPIFTYIGFSYELFVSALPQGQIINGAQNFQNNNILHRLFTNSSTYMGGGVGYASGCAVGNNVLIGFKVVQGSNNYYGWARLNVHPGTIILKEYAIKLTPNAAIQAGVIPACPMPVNLHITNLTNHSAKLNWNTQTQAIGYKIQYRKTGTSGWLFQYVSGNIGFKNITNLLPNTSYDWQVRTICQQNPLVQSPYTSLQTFATPLRMEDESSRTGVTVTGNELFIFPNPAGNEIHLLIGDGGDYELKIFNMFGQQVATDKINLAEDQSVTVNTATLTAGTYQIIVTGNEGNFTGRFVKE